MSISGFMGNYLSLSIERQASFAILCAMKVYPEPDFTSWGEKWIKGEDMTIASANRIQEKTNAIWERESEIPMREAIQAEEEKAIAENRRPYSIQWISFHRILSDAEQALSIALPAIEAAIHSIKANETSNKSWKTRFYKTAYDSALEVEEKARKKFGIEVVEQFYLVVSGAIPVPPFPPRDEALALTFAQLAETNTQPRTRTSSNFDAVQKSSTSCLLIILTLAGVLTAPFVLVAIFL